MSLLRRRLLMAAMAKKDYITDGLILRLDAIKKTHQGHSSDTEIWYDLSPSENNAELTNCIWHDNYIMFETDTDIGFGTLTNAVNLSISSPITIEIVANFNVGKWNNLYYQKILSNTNTSLRNAQGASVYPSINSLWQDDSVRFLASFGTGYRFNRIMGYYLSPKYYTHTIALAIDKPNNFFKGYRDGGGGSSYSEKEYEVNGTVTSPWQYSTSYRYLTNASKFYALRVYDRILSPSEIAYNNNLDKNRFGI